MGATMLSSGCSPSLLRFFCRCNSLPSFLNRPALHPCKSTAVSYSCGKFAGAQRRRTRQCFCTSTSSSSSSDSTATSTKPALLDGDGINAEDDSDEITKIKQVANTLDIRVGKILKAWKHEEAESLYVEEVDVGEPEPRIICSGLVQYVPLQDLQDIHVVVLSNLKPRNMRGIKSFGMLMAASDALHENVELLVPPEGSAPGERIWFGSEDEMGDLPETASPNLIQKKKIWELVQPHLRTDDSCVASLGPYVMRALKGVVFCKSLKNARIS